MAWLLYDAMEGLHHTGSDVGRRAGSWGTGFTWIRDKGDGCRAYRHVTEIQKKGRFRLRLLLLVLSHSTLTVHKVL